MGFAKFANLTYHHEILHFAVKCHKFRFLYLLASK